MNLFLIVLASVAIACLVVGTVACNLYMYSQAATVLKRWAKREGYRVVRRARMYFFRGPHFGAPAGHIVFRVTLEDQDGLARVAWVDCGNPLWDDNPRPEVLWDHNR